MSVKELPRGDRRARKPAEFWEVRHDSGLEQDQVPTCR